MLKKIIFFTLAALLFAVSPAFAQGRAFITGRVIDNYVEIPVAGVTVTVCGTDKTAITDAAGRFSLPAEVDDTVKFGFFGYKPEIYAVSKTGDDDIGDVKLKKESE